MTESAAMPEEHRRNVDEGSVALVERASVTGTAGSALRATLLGGLIAGTVDIVAAGVISKVSPIVILLVIASGVLGKAAFHARADLIALGLLLQWMMSLLIAGIYVYAGRRAQFLRRRWIAGGLAYGVIVFFVMNFIVVPLSAVPRLPGFTALSFCENLAAMLLFGLIVAFCARRNY